MTSYEPVARIPSLIFLMHVNHSIPACVRGHCICSSALKVVSRASTSCVRAVSSSSLPYCSSTPVRVSSTSLWDLSSSWSYQSIKRALIEVYYLDKFWNGRYTHLIVLFLQSGDSTRSCPALLTDLLLQGSDPIIDLLPSLQFLLRGTPLVFK